MNRSLKEYPENAWMPLSLSQLSAVIFDIRPAMFRLIPPPNPLFFLENKFLSPAMPLIFSA